MKNQISLGTKEGSLHNISLFYWNIQHDAIKNHKYRLRSKGHLLKVY